MNRLPLRVTNLLLVSWIVALAVSGCAGSTASPSARASVAPSATVTASPSAIASTTPSPSPSASPSLKGVFSTTGSMVGQRDQGVTSTLLTDGRVLVTGGTNGSVSPGSLSSAEIYDPATGQWTLTGSMAGAHIDCPASRLLDTLGAK
jgi:uncharacterized protein YceK